MKDKNKGIGEETPKQNKTRKDKKESRKIILILDMLELKVKSVK